MLDSHVRPLIEAPLARMATGARAVGLTANRVTLIGFLCGLICFLFLAQGEYGAALVFMLAGRLLDGVDGAVARQSAKGATDLGGFLDTVCDLIFYAGFPFFFAVGQPGAVMPAAFLVFSFMGTASSFLAYAVIAVKRGINHEEQGKKSYFYLGGLAEGTETMIAFTLICLLPGHFGMIASLFGALCWLTTAGRVMQGVRDFG
ncbi:MAG TPA: CDP-alcohol phosphatidyltransferase family protein [Micavibrio sp.]|jgi:phosphatidylglycerophosphate synthase